MKKKLFGLMMSMALALPVFVNAEGGSVKIGEELYPSLKDAVEDVAVCGAESCDATTITVLEDHETSGIVFESGKNLIIDLGGFTVTFKEPTVGSEGTETQDMQMLKDSTIVIKNGKFVSSDTDSSKMFIQNYANLTLKDVEIDATNELNQYALSNNSGVVSIEGTTSIKATAVAFDVYGWYTYYKNGPQVTVNTTGTIEGDIEVTADSATATKELSLLIKNVNHVGVMSVQEGLEDKVTIENGTYTDENLAEVITPAEGAEVYEVVDPETGDFKYVVATEDDIESLIFEDEDGFLDAKDLEETLKELYNGVGELEGEEAEITQALIDKLKKALDGKVLVSSHDIYYFNFIGDNIIADQETVTELEKAVKVTLNIPEGLEKVKDGYTRKYSIVRLHVDVNNGEILVDELDATEKDGVVSFESDKFSTFILTYQDVKATTNPNTFDGISSVMIISCLSLIALVAVVVFAKNKKLFN